MGTHNRKARLEERRTFTLGLVRRVLQRVVNGDLEAQEGLRQVRTMYLDESELLNDLKELAGLVDDSSSEEMVTAAREWLERNPVAR